MALAGGPGQPALPFAESFVETLGPIASTRDLIVFDQRGIGMSQPLSCHAFENPRLYHSQGALVGACARQIGPRRSFYTSADTVADIEAIRLAGGYEKLVLYGTSYGTKVAEEYAQTHPQNVEALVLDSVVPPNGPEPLDRATFEAVPRILRELCVDHLCAHITRNPVADLAKVVRRMRRAPLRGVVLDGNGHAHTVEVDIEGPAGHPARQRLLAGHTRGSDPVCARGGGWRQCPAGATAGGRRRRRRRRQSRRLRWRRCTTRRRAKSRLSRGIGRQSPHARLAEATKYIRSLPASATAPFTPADMLAFSDIEECA